jgi:hypothetical protein
MGVTHNFESGPDPKIISTQISEQNILMWFLSHNIPKRNKLAEKISQKKPEYMLNDTVYIEWNSLYEMIRSTLIDSLH